MNPVLAAHNANIVKMQSAALPETFARSLDREACSYWIAYDRAIPGQATAKHNC
ncbi:hypothetical protein [Microcoleus sp. herbarium14]|uniref:hypothetical protein n=1 Tax=Microcoleus sp. herbarium14 TaxID=3055439 RepID=UPI002FD0779B